jgi:adenylate cyclase
VNLLLILAAIALLIAEAAYHAGALSGAENTYTDLWHQISGVRYAPRHTAFVVVDETSLSRYPDDPLVFWPPLFARAAATAREAGAAVIGIDFLFSITPENWLNRYGLSKNEALQKYDLTYRQELNQGKIVLVGSIIRGETSKPDSLLLAHTEYLLSLPNMDLQAGVGLADLEFDEDGTVRRFTRAPAINLPKNEAAGAPRLSFAALLALRAQGGNAAAAPVTPAGARETISYLGPQGTIPRVPFYKLLEKDALNDPAVKALRGKIVIIGADYFGSNDLHTTPYGGSLTSRARTAGMPGAEIHANIVETLLSGKTTQPAPHALRLIANALMLLLAVGIMLRTSPWIGVAVAAVGSLVALAIGYGAFQQFVLYPSAHLQLGLISGFLLVLGLRLTREERDKARIRNMFEGYVSDDVVEMLLASGQKLDVGGQSMHITVLFSDIRSFTTITEQLTATETVEFLNVYFGRVINVIQAEGGRIDKFIGDAVMAEFGVPYPFEDHALRALRAAAGMRAVAEDFKGWMRTRFPDKKLPEFGVGIGIHSGNAVVGNLGSAKRMEYTAIGDTVNVASRLEGETKTLSCVIVASAETVRLAGDKVVTGRHDELKVKGRVEPVEVYEIVEVRA